MKNNLKKTVVFLLVLPLLISCTGKKIISLEPQGIESVKNVNIEKGNLRVVFIDNTEMPPAHRAGYNGIAELYHTEQDSTVFVPAYAGFNLEHIFSGDTLEQFYEPRVNPMTLFKKCDSEVMLHQKATPISRVESLTEFKVVEPCYIDITFSCIIHDIKYFRHGYAGFFWASYINRPQDKSIYFRGVTEGKSVEGWISSFTETHGMKSTHRGLNEKNVFFFAPDFKATLANNYSDYRFVLPFYYGRFHNMALAYLFKSSEVIRLTQSPSGGGSSNPAWDFQYIIPDPRTEKVYSFKARILYKPFIGNQDILEEYNKWEKGN
jgi:hypothetical protein